MAVAIAAAAWASSGTIASAQEEGSPHASIATALAQADQIPVVTRADEKDVPARVEVSETAPSVVVATDAGTLKVTLEASSAESSASVGNARGFGDVAPGTDAVVRPQEGGAQILSVMKDAAASSSQRYRLDLPAGTTLEAIGGGYSLLNGGELIGAINAPWARDAAGKNLPSTYTLEGDTLVQRTDTADAQFPVVADPRFTVGRGIDMALNGAEIRVYRGAIVAIGLGAAAVGCTQVARIPHAGLKAFMTSSAPPPESRTPRTLRPQSKKHLTTNSSTPTSAIRRSLSAPTPTSGTRYAGANATDAWPPSCASTQWLLYLTTRARLFTVHAT
jgi:hypothetical protein